MPRVARIVIPGCEHHVTQRGNNRQAVFFTDADYATYIGLLRERTAALGVSVAAYCLMPNYVHLILTPGDADGLAKAVGQTHFAYTQYVNRLHGRSGHLWQNRFYSCALDQEHFWTAAAYVERNPVLASLVRRAWKYRWSSAAAHVSGRDESGLLNLARWTRRLPPDGDWREALASRQDDETLDRVRLHLSRGRPLGTDKWLSKLEAAMNCRLRPLPVGRPKHEDGQQVTVPYYPPITPYYLRMANR